MATTLLVVMVILAVLALRSSSGISAPRAGPLLTGPAGDPLAYRPGSDASLARRAAAGTAQVLFTKSPGGVLATAARVAGWRPLIDAAVRGTDIPPAMLEGIVFLESAGRADAVAGGSVTDAAGLTQILPGTAQSLLGMHVDLARSEQLFAELQRAQATGRSTRANRLRQQLARADARFDPAAALAGAVHYLEMAERVLGRLDLAVVAYHAGIGNVQTVLDDYDGGRAVSYEQLFFGTGPDDHATAWSFLSGLGDDASLYLWRVLEAEHIMRLYRAAPAELRRLTAQETGYPSNALTLVPEASVQRFRSPQALSAAYQSGELVSLPRDPARLHLRYARSMGALAHRLGVPAGLYRGLRPSALTALIQMAALVHRLAGGSLSVVSTVLDARYQQQLGYSDPPGTTGFTFLLSNHFTSPAQAQAFQFVLGRLQSLDLLAYIQGSTTTEVTVAPDAGRVLHSGI